MIFPKAPPIPVMIKIGAACSIPFFMELFKNVFLLERTRPKANSIPMPNAEVGFVIKDKKVTPRKSGGKNFNKVPIHISSMGTKMGSKALKKEGILTVFGLLFLVSLRIGS